MSSTETTLDSVSSVLPATVPESGIPEQEPPQIPTTTPPTTSTATTVDETQQIEPTTTNNSLEEQNSIEPENPVEVYHFSDSENDELAIFMSDRPHVLVRRMSTSEDEEEWDSEGKSLYYSKSVG